MEKETAQRTTERINSATSYVQRVQSLILKKNKGLYLNELVLLISTDTATSGGMKTTADDTQLLLLEVIITVNGITHDRTTTTTPTPTPTAAAVIRRDTQIEDSSSSTKSSSIGWSVQDDEYDGDEEEDDGSDEDEEKEEKEDDYDEENEQDLKYAPVSLHLVEVSLMRKL